MPFRLRNTSNTFQRTIDHVKNQLSFCFAVQDDLEAASKDEMEHRQHLRTIFARLRQHGFVINAEKCICGAPPLVFWAKSGCWWCHSTSSVRYVSAVVEFPLPLNVKELQAFLGILNFCRRFLLLSCALCRPRAADLRFGAGLRAMDCQASQTPLLHRQAKYT
jgi:hypothetical protein